VKKISNIFNLTGKVVIITGADGQLGRQYTKIFIDFGAVVAGIDTRFNNLKSQSSFLKSGKFLPIQADVTDKKSIAEALAEIELKLGSPNVLVNNAAIDAPPNADETSTGPFENYPESSWDMMMKVNLKGVFLCCQIIGKRMAETGGGSIINISSIYGILSPDQRIYGYKKRPFFKPIAYSASKSGILNITRYLAIYWAEKKVRVNTLTLAGVYNHQDDEFLKNYTSRVPLGRMAKEDEYNGAVIFLASDASSYMTGSNLIIDGGYSAW